MALAPGRKILKFGPSSWAEENADDVICRKGKKQMKSGNCHCQVFATRVFDEALSPIDFEEYT
jgi:hypothetical protein